MDAFLQLPLVTPFMSPQHADAVVLVNLSILHVVVPLHGLLILTLPLHLISLLHDQVQRNLPCRVSTFLQLQSHLLTMLLAALHPRLDQLSLPLALLQLTAFRLLFHPLVFFKQTFHLLPFLAQALAPAPVALTLLPGEDLHPCQRTLDLHWIRVRLPNVGRVIVLPGVGGEIATAVEANLPSTAVGRKLSVTRVNVLSLWIRLRVESLLQVNGEEHLSDCLGVSSHLLPSWFWCFRHQEHWCW